MKLKYTMFILCYFFIVLFAISVNMCNANRTGNAFIKEKSSNYRLPTTSIPTKYELWLTIDLEEFHVSGLTEIYLTVLEETNIIALNYKNLEFVDTNIKLNKLNAEGDVEKQVELVSLDKNDLLEIFQLTYVTLTVGEYLLQIHYTTLIGDNLKGIYRSSYFKDGVKRYIATTFFAATYARMAFPCYDEPHFKATFIINIIHDKNLHALSNMKLINDDVLEDNTDLRQSTFKETPKMSTYLVAFIVSDFTSKMTNDESFNIYSQQHAIEKTTYALEVGQESIKEFQKLTGYNYQLEKLDLVAIDDFLMGAMENWGLITFKSSNLLRSDNNNNAKQSQKIVKIVTHELAHQWFGNDVTCHWWSDIWLNEGFATYMEDRVSAKIRPHWRLLDQFAVNVLQFVMQLDNTEDVHPMTFDVTTVDEMNSIYDFVAYKKAGSVIRMFEHIVTTPVFEKAMESYLDLWKGKVATPDNLFSALQSAVNDGGITLPPISELFKTWTLNGGFPVVTAVYDKNKHTILLTQEKFLSSGSKNISSKYSIPINFATATLANFTETTPTDMFLATETSKTIEIDLLDDWFILNKQQTGYYRVNYDNENWIKIVNELNKTTFEKIHPINRAQLIDDTINLAKHDYLAIETALEVLKYIRQETDYIPMTSAILAIRYLDRMLREMPDYDIVKNFIFDLIGKTYESYVNLTITEDKHIERLFQSDIVNLACYLGHKQCIEDAKIKFVDEKIVSNNIRSGIYCGVTKYNNSMGLEWSLLMQRCINISSTEELRMDNNDEFDEILLALGCSLSTETLNFYLNLSISENAVLPLDGEYRSKVYESVLTSSSLGTNLALIFLRHNFDKMEKYYKSLSETILKLGPFIVTTTQQNMLNEAIEQNREFITDDIEKSFNYINELAIININFYEQKSQKIKKWIENYYKSDTGSGVNLLINIKLLLLLISCLVVKWF